MSLEGIGRNVGAFFLPNQSKVGGKKEEDTTKPTFTGEKAGSTKNLGGELDQLAALNQMTLSQRAEVNRRSQGFDIDAIKAQYGDLGEDTKAGLNVFANNPNAVSMFNTFDAMSPPALAQAQMDVAMNEFFG
jgi:hypothetical protein